MSHFTVLVRLPATVGFDDVESEVEKMLIPYKESGCGGDDPPGLEQYLKFHDEEQQHLADYETDKAEVFVDPSGKPHSQHSDRFRWNPPGSIGIGGNTEYRCPAGWTATQVSFAELYGSFEKYMADYCGYKARDKKTGRYGYWQNPNRKWDWWEIGGRWTGYFPVQTDPHDRQSRAELEAGNGEPGLMTKRNADPAKADFCRIASIDFDKAAADARERMDKFWGEWVRFCDGEKMDAWGGPRDKAVSLGLVDCKNADELTGKEWRTIKWPRQTKEGVDRFDVLTQITRDEFTAKYTAAFNPLKPWACLDDKGWNEPGKIGWWAFSSDTPESYMKYADGFMAWLRGGDQRDWVVAVDCHI